MPTIRETLAGLSAAERNSLRDALLTALQAVVNPEAPVTSNTIVINGRRYKVSTQPFNDDCLVIRVVKKDP